METISYLLIIQGILGGFDVLWNHEWNEKLPSKPDAALEQVIHGIRELFYAVVFLGLAWYHWQGFWAWVFFMLIVVEILLTAWDFVVEDQTRKLSPTERITHLILSMNGGAYVGFLVPVLIDWSTLPNKLSFVDYGLNSLLLSVLGIGVLAWGIRDLWSGIKLSNRNRVTFFLTQNRNSELSL
jgi:hypothetical protein